VKVVNAFKGVEWIGRHFVVTKAEYPVRLYTTVLCLSEENDNYRNELVRLYEANDHDGIKKLK
jgi:hypothetical protein